MKYLMERELRREMEQLEHSLHGAVLGNANKPFLGCIRAQASDGNGVSESQEILVVLYLRKDAKK